MFLDLTGVEHCMDLEAFGRQLRQHVYDCTRLTIGVGAGPTKTLAKSGQLCGETWKQHAAWSISQAASGSVSCWKRFR
jgi:DNA polymerase V